MLGGFCFGKNPVQRLFQITKDADSALPSAFTEDFKHSSESEAQIVGHEKGTARDVALGQFAHVFGSKVESGNIRKIK